MATASHAPRIFISHNHRDNDFGIRLVEDLRQVIGDESAVWYDSRGGLNGGDIWWKIIKKELRQRNIFIVILSPNSLKAPWVEKEIDIAWTHHVRRKMKIIPILYQPCKVPEDLQTIHTISFLAPKLYEETFEELKIALRISKAFVGIKIAKSPNDYRVDRMQQLVQEVEVAYHKEDWLCVIEKINVITNQYPEAMLPSLYCMQGWAYYFEGQSRLAQAALEKGIKVVKDPQKRLSLLDLYIAQFISDGQWDRSLPWINEALQLDPHNSTLQMARVDALEKTHQYRHVFPERAATHSLSNENLAEVQIENIHIASEEKNAQRISDDQKGTYLKNKNSGDLALDQKIKEIEINRQQLILQKERFQLEKELMTFAFEMSEKVASVYTEVDSATKVMLLRTFLPKFSSLEDEKKS